MNIKTLLLLLLIFLTGSRLLAEAPTSISGLNQSWINVGPGFVGGKEFGGFSFGTSISYFPGRHIISGRYLVAFNPLMIEIKKGATHIEYLSDVSLLYGIIEKYKWGFGSASAGIGLVRGNRKIGREYAIFEEEKFLALSIPFEFQVFLTPLPIIGMGLYFFGNFNNETSYLGALLCLQIGLLR